MTYAIVLPGPVVLRDPLPSGWVRCPELGCGAPVGHAGEHVRESVPPVAVDDGAEHRAFVARTRAEVARWPAWKRSNAALGLPVAPPDPPQAPPDRAGAPPDPCTCNGHGPDLACPEHGAGLMAWTVEHGT